MEPLRGYHDGGVPWGGVPWGGVPWGGSRWVGDDGDGVLDLAVAVAEVDGTSDVLVHLSVGGEARLGHAILQVDELWTWMGRGGGWGGDGMGMGWG
jgi:hypothetical protein